MPTVTKPLKVGWLILTCLALAACTRPAPDIPSWGPATGVTPGISSPPSFQLPPTRAPGAPILTPTPDLPHLPPTPQTGPEQYVVQPGDTLGAIAMRYDISVEDLVAANQLADPNSLDVGQMLVIPVPTPLAGNPGFKIIPDSELIFGPMNAFFDLPAFIEEKDGYLAYYQQELDGEILNGNQIVLRIAQNYSVNPRLLLALIDYRAGWATQPLPDPDTLEYPLGYQDPAHAGLYRQLSWAANALNQGYYLWRVGGVSGCTLADGSVVPIDPTINAGTAGVQNLFAHLDDYPTWQEDVSLNGLFATYFSLFGYPFDFSIEPLISPGLSQPVMQLPFETGQTWAFTGGPHGGWDSGSAWAALDFAPGDVQGCAVSDAWVVAVADGQIVRADHSVVVQDLDGDGYEQTGWTVLYMHVENRNRIQPGVYLRKGDRIGHPACEGGIYTGTHVHLARRYHGEWIPADGALPFVLDGWVSSGTGTEYDGFLRRGDQSIEAYDGNNPLNQIQR